MKTDALSEPSAPNNVHQHADDQKKPPGYPVVGNHNHNIGATDFGDQVPLRLSDEKPADDQTVLSLELLEPLPCPPNIVVVPNGKSDGPPTQPENLHKIITTPGSESPKSRYAHLLQLGTVQAGLCLAIHFLWGLFPVVLRHLQVGEHIRTLPLFAFSSAMLLAFYCPFAFREYGWALLKNRKLWLFGVVVTIRSITLFYAAFLTHATLVMLLQLTAPYFVSILTRVYNHETLPRAFFSTLLLSIIGATMILSSDIAKLDFTSLTVTDFWGMLMSLISAIFLAGYMVIIRACAKDKINPNAIQTAQMASGLLFGGLASFAAIGEWQSFGGVSVIGWVWYFVYVLIMLVGNHSQMWIIGIVGAPFNSMFIGWRLCVAILCGWVILGEGLHSPFQAVGIGVVVVAISTFLYLQTVKNRTTTSTAAACAEPPPPKSGES